VKPKVVFDTNIYIRKLLSSGGGGDKLFSLFRQCKIDLYTSKGQLQELIEAATLIHGERKKKKKENFALEDLEALVVLLLSKAYFVSTGRQHKVSPDTDDDFIIGIAIKAKASFLITENTKDIYQAIMPKTPPVKVLNVSQALNLWLPKKKSL
jgi:putative PIN family toxin of toxin-antitoxin system